jgi:hypothetical protein
MYRFISKKGAKKLLFSLEEIIEVLSLSSQKKRGVLQSEGDGVKLFFEIMK